MTTMKTRALWFALLAWVATFTACSRPAPRLDGEATRTLPWSDELVEQVASTPVQAEGRVKPLSVLAAFTLYDVHGRRDLKYSIPGPDGSQQKVTLEPTEWLLDVWCYPRQAARYPLFRIENVGVMDALGFANNGQRQDFEYLSYAQIYEVVDKLQELAQRYSGIEQRERSAVQEHILSLWGDFLKYDRLQRQMGALHYTIPVEEPALQQLFGAERVNFGRVVANAVGFKRMLEAQDPQMRDAPKGLLDVAEFVGKAITNDDDGAGLLAPVASGEVASREEAESWLTLGAGLEQVIKGAEGPLKDTLLSLQRAVSADALGTKESALLAYREASVQAAMQGPDYDHDKIELETYYYRAAWHYQSIHWFLFAFVLAAVCWLVPRSKLLWGASLGVTVLALGMLSYDVVLRCLITERPPIKNLYDTFLFIAAVGVLLAVITEIVLPRRIALAAAPVTGALLVMFARMFEVADGSDTMNPLVAVLDSNFWLATHVTTINIGYAAGLVAALLANVWILMRVLRIAHPDDASAKSLVRMVYGVTCFGLAFAVVGTILGGVWANDSWGRFWGWDPKENGALMICLAQVALLHARFSGLVRDFGFVVWSAITGAVVVFSWFHVNLLGIGLHSYGFSSGLRDAVWTSYVVQLGFVLVGTVDVLLRPNPARVKRAASAAAAAPAS
ncbi:MAG: cytochrome c biogenesis protein CcsA [Planctomycetota bacterium]|nr:cytochrome c biogenesis protein CcsA [Planctomycetota bacterium]